MPKKYRFFVGGFIDILSLIAVVFLIATAVTGVAVVNKQNSNFDIRNKAATTVTCPNGAMAPDGDIAQCPVNPTIQPPVATSVPFATITPLATTTPPRITTTCPNGALAPDGDISQCPTNPVIPVPSQTATPTPSPIPSPTSTPAEKTTTDQTKNTPTPVPTSAPTSSPTSSACSPSGTTALCGSLNCCSGLTKVTGIYGYCGCQETSTLSKASPSLLINGEGCTNGSECQTGNCSTTAQYEMSAPVTYSFPICVASLTDQATMMSSSAKANTAAALAAGSILAAPVATQAITGTIATNLAAGSGLATLPLAAYSYGTAALSTSPALQTAVAIATLSQGPLAYAACKTQGTDSAACQLAAMGITAGYQMDPGGTVQALQSSAQTVNQNVVRPGVTNYANSSIDNLFGDTSNFRLTNSPDIGSTNLSLVPQSYVQESTAQSVVDEFVASGGYNNPNLTSPVQGKNSWTTFFTDQSGHTYAIKTEAFNAIDANWQAMTTRGDEAFWQSEALRNNFAPTTFVENGNTAYGVQEYIPGTIRTTSDSTLTAIREHAQTNGVLMQDWLDNVITNNGSFTVIDTGRAIDVKTNPELIYQTLTGVSLEDLNTDPNPLDEWFAQFR